MVAAPLLFLAQSPASRLQPPSKRTREEEVAVVVEAPLVAGAEPPLRRERLGVGRVVVEVPFRHVGALDADLADLALRQLGAGGVEDRDAHAALRLADGAGLARAALGQRVGRHLVRGLGHRVGLEDGHLFLLLAVVWVGGGRKEGRGTRE